MIYNIIFSLFLFTGLSAYASSPVMKGLKCEIPVNNWSETEKNLLKKAVVKDGITDFFFMPTENFSTKDNPWCRYRNTFFVTGFRELDIGGKILISETSKIRKKKTIVSIEYGIYQKSHPIGGRGDDSDYYFAEMSRLRIQSRSGVVFPSILKHNTSLGYSLYIVVVIVLYEDNKKELYAMRVRPKGYQNNSSTW